MSRRLAQRMRVQGGGHVAVEQTDDGRIDLSVIAPEGPSAAIYLLPAEVQLLVDWLSARVSEPPIFTREDLWLLYELLNEAIAAEGTSWTEHEQRISNRLHDLLYAAPAGEENEP